MVNPPVGNGGVVPEVEARIGRTVALTRLPEFIAEDPEMWFVMVESLFQRYSVTDKQDRLTHIVPALPPRVAKQLRDVIMKEQTPALYDELKAQLIKRLGISQGEKTNRLLEGEKMGDEKPSEYLRRLQEIGGEIPEHLLQSIWLRGLPDGYRMTMAAQRGQSLENMAEVADNIHETVPTRQAVFETAASQDTSIATALQNLQLEMAKYARNIRSPSEGRRGRSPTPHRSNPQTQSRSGARSRGPRPQGICWYHWIFNEKADKCTQPCNWTPGNAQGSR
ncbi:uncharacterized protein LOC123261346 [Cotesia glomerata]|uniref:uncharacterized protein LOC123261346 n=1 Tax=Cotesia glomerata TaxID=32391 RepID=UPI001D0030E9|nr:uncharacterized protein LOC123261346 [Cotesia glomerata]